jgi:hypothetical protein
VYHSLCPLEPGTAGNRRGAPEEAGEKSKRVFGLGTEVYKAVCELDGNAYVLRRAEGKLNLEPGRERAIGAPLTSFGLTFCADCRLQDHARYCL